MLPKYFVGLSRSSVVPHAPRSIIHVDYFCVKYLRHNHCMLLWCNIQFYMHAWKANEYLQTDKHSFRLFWESCSSQCTPFCSFPPPHHLTLSFRRLTIEQRLPLPMFECHKRLREITIFWYHRPMPCGRFEAHPVRICLYESGLFCPHCRKPVLFPEVITTIVHGVATPFACISCRRIMTVRFYRTRYMIFTGTFVNHSSVITPAIFNA